MVSMTISHFFHSKLIIIFWMGLIISHKNSSVQCLSHVYNDTNRCYIEITWFLSLKLRKIRRKLNYNSTLKTKPMTLHWTLARKSICTKLFTIWLCHITDSIIRFYPLFFFLLNFIWCGKTTKAEGICTEIENEWNRDAWCEETKE